MGAEEALVTLAYLAVLVIVVWSLDKILDRIGGNEPDSDE